MARNRPSLIGMTSALWQKVTRAPALVAGQLEGIADDAFGRRLRDDAQALDHAGNDDVLLAGIQALGVFADDDEIDVADRAP